MRTRTGKSIAVTLAVMLSLGLVAVSCADDSENGASETTTSAAGGGSGEAGDGEELYGSSCASCHGVDAKGLPNLGRDLTNSEFLDGLTDDEAVAFIKEGRPASHPDNQAGVDMPPKGGNPALTDDDLAAIVAYLRSL